MTEFIIENFYLYFQGILLFQVGFFGMIYFINKKRDTLIYSLLNLVTSIYFYLNATDTFFKIDVEIIFNSPYYIYLNFALFLAMMYLYLLFIHEIFMDDFQRKNLQLLYVITLYTYPILYVLYVLFSFLNLSTDVIFYAAHLINGPVVSMVLWYNFHTKGFKSLIVRGMLVVFVCLLITIFLTIRYNNGETPSAFDKYPLLFIRIGMLVDIFLFQWALLKRWNEQEKTLITKDFESKLAVEKLTNRIAADLHDEIGANLSSITFLVGSLQKKIKGNDKDLSFLLEKITDNSTESATLINDTIWTLNPSFDTFEKLLERIKSFASGLLASNDIAFTIENNLTDKQLDLSMEQRRNLYLIMKEAINNVAKHASANKVILKIIEDNRGIKISVEDNGKGFDAKKIYEGNGLENYKKRAIGSEIDVKIASKINFGTSVDIYLLTKNH
jgi:signal transduction histidine kinase